MVSTAQPYLVWNWILTNTANSNNNRNLVKMMDGESITFNHKCFPYANSRGGKWAGWVINGLGNKWVGCIIIHLSIYDPFIYKLIIHYQPNPFN